jgi:hypothetical protein
MNLPLKFRSRRLLGIGALVVVAMLSTGVALSDPAGRIETDRSVPAREAAVVGEAGVLLVDDNGVGRSLRKGRARVKAPRARAGEQTPEASSVAVEAFVDPAADPLNPPIVKADDAANPPPPQATPNAPERFSTRPPGATLPSGAWCAERVRPAGEIRPENASVNNTRGTNPNDQYPRVDGDFVGTTDEILQWAACKWGIDEDMVRAQAVVESTWRVSTEGDLSSDQSQCHPQVRKSNGPCPQSVGLLQVKYNHHGSAYEDANAIRSSAYNVDYAYAVWRECFEGRTTWLNTVDRGREYGPGDLEGCMGRWYAGRWYTSNAVTYINEVKRIFGLRRWESTEFIRWG